jgi:hypothetical protein
MCFTQHAGVFQYIHKILVCQLTAKPFGIIFIKTSKPIAHNAVFPSHRIDDRWLSALLSVIIRTVAILKGAAHDDYVVLLRSSVCTDYTDCRQI